MNRIFLAIAIAFTLTACRHTKADETYDEVTATDEDHPVLHAIGHILKSAGKGMKEGAERAKSTNCVGITYGNTTTVNCN